MSIPSRLSDYLEQRGTSYDVLAHEHSHSSAETARTAHVPARQLAKSVIVEDGAGCVMAVIPADCSLMLDRVAQMLGRANLRLADENRIVTLFGDCDRGAVPPIGMAWGIETIVDDELEANDVVYIEGGDHEQVLRLSHDQFHELMGAARHGRFCKAQVH